MKGVERAGLILRWPEDKLKQSSCLLLKGGDQCSEKLLWKWTGQAIIPPEILLFNTSALFFSNISFLKCLRIDQNPIVFEGKENYSASRARLLMQRSSMEEYVFPSSVEMAVKHTVFQWLFLSRNTIF